MNDWFQKFAFKCNSYRYSLESLAAHLASRGAIAFPALHGAFGEDGTLQATLEAAGVPFVGTGAAQAATAFDKFTCTAALASHGFPTLPMVGCCTAVASSVPIALESTWSFNHDPIK